MNNITENNVLFKSWMIVDQLLYLNIELPSNISSNEVQYPTIIPIEYEKISNTSFIYPTIPIKIKTSKIIVFLIPVSNFSFGHIVSNNLLIR